MGAVFVTVGYVLAILGGGILFFNTPPDVGGTHALMLPTTNSDIELKDGTETERRSIRSRRHWNRFGFFLLSFGGLLQLAGYWVDRQIQTSLAGRPDQGPLSWTLDHAIGVTVVVVALGILLSVAAFRLANRFTKNPAAGGAAVSLVIAVVFSLGLTQFWAAKRDYDQRIASIQRDHDEQIASTKRDHDEQIASRRAQHLQRLQPVLRSEAERLRGMAKTLEERGYVAGPEQTQRANIWSDVEVMSEDIRNHFPDYYTAKEAFITAALRAGREYQEITRTIDGRIRAQIATGDHRAWVIPALVDKCVGIGPTMKVTISADNQITYETPTTSGSGKGGPEDVLRAQNAFEVFNRFTFENELHARCQQLQKDVMSIAENAKAAASMAILASEQTMLPGDCKFVRLAE